MGHERQKVEALRTKLEEVYETHGLMVEEGPLVDTHIFYNQEADIVLSSFRRGDPARTDPILDVSYHPIFYACARLVNSRDGAFFFPETGTVLNDFSDKGIATIEEMLRGTSADVVIALRTNGKYGIDETRFQARELIRLLGTTAEKPKETTKGDIDRILERYA